MPLTGLLGTPFSSPGSVELATPYPVEAEVGLQGSMVGRGTLEAAYVEHLDLALTGSMRGQGSTHAPIPYGWYGYIEGQGSTEATLSVSLVEQPVALDGQGSTSAALAIALAGPTEGLVGQGTMAALLEAESGLVGSVHGQGSLEPEYAQVLDVDLTTDGAQTGGQGSTTGSLLGESDLVGSVLGQGSTSVALQIALQAPTEGLHGQGSTEAVLIPSAGLSGSLGGQGSLQPEYAQVLDVDLAGGGLQTGGQGSTTAELEGANLRGAMVGRGWIEPEYLAVLEVTWTEDTPGVQGQGSTDAVLTLVGSVNLAGSIVAQGTLEGEYAELLDIDLARFPATLAGHGSTQATFWAGLVLEGSIVAQGSLEAANTAADVVWTEDIPSLVGQGSTAAMLSVDLGSVETGGQGSTEYDASHFPLEPQAEGMVGQGSLQAIGGLTVRRIITTIRFGVRTYAPRPDALPAIPTTRRRGQPVQSAQTVTPGAPVAGDQPIVPGRHLAEGSWPIFRRLPSRNTLAHPLRSRSEADKSEPWPPLWFEETPENDP